MHKQLLVVLMLSASVISCQKDIRPVEGVVNSTAMDRISQEASSASSVVSSAHWYGTYSDLTCTDPEGLCDPDGAQAFDNQIIKNGVAQLPYLSSLSFSYSNLVFDIPPQYVITGDSITFQAVVRNSMIDGYASYDVILKIDGSEHSAELHFVGDMATQQNSEYYIGNARYYNLPQLVHYFGNFQTIKWVMKNNGTAAYINNKLAYRFTYGVANRIGTIKTIGVSGKGYPVVNSVKLLNSYNNKKIMVENFDIDGQSHTVFY